MFQFKSSLFILILKALRTGQITLGLTRNDCVPGDDATKDTTIIELFPVSEVTFTNARKYVKR